MDVGFSSLKFQSLVWAGPPLPQLHTWLSQGRKMGGDYIIGERQGVAFGFWWLLALAAPGQFPRDTVGHRHGGCVAEVAACSGHTDKFGGARAKQVFLPFFHLPAFIRAIV